MEKIELNVNLRKKIGKGPARVLRREGKIPAVLYGSNLENVLLSVSARDLDRIFKTVNIGQVLLNLVIHNGKKMTKTAMIKELQTQPVSGDLLHVDFYEVAMDQKIKVSIPFTTTGEAKGVELGGILQMVRHEVEVLCFPGEIPESIELDITDLGIGDSIHMDQIAIGENIELTDDANFTVVTVLSPKLEEEKAEEEEEEAAEEEAAEDETPAEPTSED